MKIRQAKMRQTFGKNVLFKAFAVGISALSLFAITSVPQADAAGRIIRLRSDGGTTTIRVTKGKPQTVRIDRAFSEIVVGDPEIADVSSLTDRSFYILGGKIGTTGIALFDQNKVLIGQMDIEVTYDTGSLKKVLRKRLPKSKIKVSSANGRIMLSGSAKDAPSVVEARAIAESYGEDVLSSVRVTSAQQVQLEVRFIEAERNKSKELGIRWEVAGSNLTSVIGAAGLVTTNVPFGTILGNIINSGVQADALISALEARGMARRLAEPNLVALSGHTASFLAGGEFPIPVARGDKGEVTVEFKKFGVGLEFTPTVLKDGIINLKIAPEVSEIDVANSVKYGDIEIPSLSVRRASTTVQLRDGQSFVMAGLLQNSNTISRRQFPWLGDIPILGALFRSTSYRRKETDLVIIVTPRLVKPIAPGRRIATPLDSAIPGSDVDIFARGKDDIRRNGTLHMVNSNGLPTGHIMELN